MAVRKDFKRVVNVFYMSCLFVKSVISIKQEVGKIMILYIYDNMIWYRCDFFFVFFGGNVELITLACEQLYTRYWNWLKFIEIYWNLLKLIEIYWNVLRFIEIYYYLFLLQCLQFLFLNYKFIEIVINICISLTCKWDIIIYKQTVGVTDLRMLKNAKMSAMHTLFKLDEYYVNTEREHLEM